MSLFQPISMVPFATYFELWYSFSCESRKYNPYLVCPYRLHLIRLNLSKGMVPLLFLLEYFICSVDMLFTAHGWPEAYLSPSIVLAARGAHGNRIIFDDYCEAYYWLRQNTPTDAKVMSWWDYGYQITAMGNITVIVDNNTWNNTHIATVGRAMSSYEDEAYDIMRSLDVNYVLVVFGGVTGYSSDDINK